MLLLGGFCGLRSAEIERLRWEDVNLEAGHVVLAASASKVKGRRIVPLPDCAKTWLAPYAGRTGLVWTDTHDSL